MTEVITTLNAAEQRFHLSRAEDDVVFFPEWQADGLGEFNPVSRAIDPLWETGAGRSPLVD